jgi:membrane peptidoglycan carboxypeptidase
MLPNPRYYNPFKRMDKARQRQEQVLFNMFQAKLITPEEYAQAMDVPVRLREASSDRFDLSLLSGGSSRPCHLKALEEVLLAHIGEQGLYRRGLRIRTTIDRPLQDGLVASLAAGSIPAGDVPARILVMKEGTEVRALACSEDVEQARSYPGSRETPNPTYEIMTVPPASIRKEEILLPEPGAQAPRSGDGATDQGTGTNVR